MSWPMVKLKDVASFVRGITFKPDDVIPVDSAGAVACMRTKNVQEQIDVSDVWGIPRSFVKRADQFVREGDLLVSTANSWNLVGKCSWVPALPWPATVGGFIAALRGGDRIDPRYLYHWFASSDVQARVRNCARQTTNIANLSFDRCLDLSLPLPPLPEQRRIAAILDQTDELRRKRRMALGYGKQLLSAAFIDIFGDPVTNPNGYELHRLGEVGSLDRGVSRHRPRNDPSLLNGPHPLIQTGDVSRAKDYIRCYNATYSEMGLAQSKKWSSGTVCITIAANIADTAILQFDACFPDSVVGFDSRNEALNFYVHSWFKRIKGELERIAPSVAQKNINLAILRDLEIPMPSKIEIDRFFAISCEIEKDQAVGGRNMYLLDALFTSLQHRAFRGEL